MFSFLLLLFVGCVQAFGNPRIVLNAPANGKTPIGIILIQGGEIINNNYVPLGRAIQQQLSANYSVTVVLPQFIQSLPEPLQMDSEMDKAINAMPAGIPVVAVGHSLGSVVLQYWSNNVDNCAKLKGTVLLGGYITRGNYAEGPPPTGFKCKTLALTGELDGLSRITRLAEGFHMQLDRYPGSETVWPIIIMPGQSHMAPANGEQVPGRVKKLDLKPEVSKTEGYNQLAEVIGYWTSGLLEGDDSYGMEMIRQKVAYSEATWLRTIINTMQLEGSSKFLPECRCDNTICDASPKCWNGSRWTAEYSQPYMSNLKLFGGSVSVRDSFHICSTVMLKPPYVHEPKIVSNWTCALTPDINDCIPTPCDSPKGCLLEIATITRNIYEADPLDQALAPNSASEMRTKMTSRQWNYVESGTNPNAELDETDPLTRCAEINEISVNYAKQVIPSRSGSRFIKYGVDFITGKDINETTGPGWIGSALKMNTVSVNSTQFLQLISPSLITSLDPSIPIFGHIIAGVHYCKVLSPARALEWMMVDGLRYYDGIDSTNVKPQ